MKRLDTNHESKNDASTACSHLDSNIEAETDSTPTEATENIDTDESNIWKEKPIEDVEKTREKEFEEYLADLLM